MTFEKGQSGNPAGRPRGARGKAALLAERLLEGDAEAIIRAAVEMAKAGDIAAVRVCLDRLAPRPRDRAVAFELPPLKSAADGAAALAAITAAVAEGEITPSEAGELFKLIEGFTRMHEATILEQRVAKLEREMGIPAPKSNQNAQNHQGNQISQSDPSAQSKQISQSLPSDLSASYARNNPISPYDFGDAP